MSHPWPGHGLGANEWTRQCPSSPKSAVGNPWRSPQLDHKRMAADIGDEDWRNKYPVDTYRWYNEIIGIHIAMAWLQPDSHIYIYIYKFTHTHTYIYICILYNIYIYIIYIYISLASLAQWCSSSLTPFTVLMTQDPRLCEAVLCFQHLQDVLPCHLDTVNHGVHRVHPGY